MNRVGTLDRDRGRLGLSRAATLGPAGPRPHRRTLALVAGLLPVGDALMLALTGVGAAALLPGMDDAWAGRHVAASLVTIVLFVGLASLSGQYLSESLDRRVGALGALSRMWALSVALMLAVAFVWDGHIALDRRWLIGWFLGGGACLALWRRLVALRLRRWRSEGRLAERVAIIGAPAQLGRLVEHLGQPRVAGEVELFGTYEASPAGIAELEHLLREPGSAWPDAVMVALPWSQPDRIAELCMRLRDLPVDVRLAPDLAAYDLPAGAPRRFTGLVALEVWQRPLRDWRGLVKRAEDLVIGGGLILAFAPLMALVALAIRLDTPGPVLLRQRRFGLGSAPIMMLKFRTMHVDSGDPSGALATVPGDPRVTRVGRFLRRTSLDELPQLFNVMRGEISLVGPRAHAVEMRVGGGYYHEVVRHYAARHRMKPGITGLAQINGCRGLVDTLDKAQRRLDYDLHYVENWSLGMDLRILAVTALRGFTSDGAY